MISYKIEKNLPADQLFDLYESIGWTEGVEDKDVHSLLIQKVYENSDIVLSAWENDKLIGTARAITDKYAHGIIYGLAVNPSYETVEIAKELLTKVISEFPDIQWSASVEDWEESIFRGLGFEDSKHKYLSYGKCPI